MFTGLRSTAAERIVRNLGGKLVKSVFECTHLIADKVMKNIKFLCVVARGKMIVSSKWLDACKRAGTFIDASPYILYDAASEREHSFQLRRIFGCEESHSEDASPLAQRIPALPKGIRKRKSERRRVHMATHHGRKSGSTHSIEKFSLLLFGHNNGRFNPLLIDSHRRNLLPSIPSLVQSFDSDLIGGNKISPP
ncbi:PAX-interacting protein 1-like [Oscarella lobularis]|uniref:PAX-interacting protein 1-like n=1 Tax=Oscarella lobularis TaxID=121494 RepID=UPI0033132079